MKKVLATLLASAMALTAMSGLVACDNKNKGPVLKVWAPRLSIDGYLAIIPQFKELHPEYKDYNIKFEPQDESAVQTALGKDPSTGAALFFLPSDHMYILNSRGILQALPQEYRDIVEARDEQFTYEAVTINNNLMAFPVSNDNGLFMYYDSEFYTEEDVKSLDTMQEKAKAAGKHISFDYDDSYYVASMYIGTGCEFNYGDYTLKTYHTNIGEQPGEDAAKAYWRYLSEERNNKPGSKDQVIVNTEIKAGFESGYVAGVGGTWKWTTIKELKNSSKIKTAILPKFKVTDDSEPIQMGTFYGAKYCGVNALKDAKTIKVALALAEFLTSEVGQYARYKATNSIPSNKKLVEENEDIKKDPLWLTYKAQVEAKGFLHKDQTPTFWGSSGIKNPIKKIAVGEITSLEDAIKEVKALGASLEKK